MVIAGTDHSRAPRATTNARSTLAEQKEQEEKKGESRKGWVIIVGAVLTGVATILAAVFDIGEYRDEEEPFAVVDTLPSGIVEVRNTAQGLWESDQEWRAEEVLRIGTLSGEGPDLFGEIRSLELDALGRIWVYEGQARELRVFDRDGTHVRTVGRNGEGPGEFSNVSGMTWNPDGNLVTVDPRLGRISVFDTSGHYLAGFRPRWLYRMFPWRGGIDERGFLYDMQWLAGDIRTPILVRFDSSLTAVDTLAIPMHPDGEQFFEHITETSFVRYSVPFTGMALWRLAQDGGLWIAITDQYRLIRLGPEGDTVRISTRPFEPIPVTDEDVDPFMERMRERDVPAERSRIPSTKPPVERLFLDDEGNVWVIPRREGDDRGRWIHVFDPDGLYLGEFALPVPIGAGNSAVVRDNTLVAAITDSLGVPYVTRMEIWKPGSGR